MEDQGIDKSAQFRLSCAGDRNLPRARRHLPDADFGLRFSGDSVSTVGDRQNPRSPRKF